MARLVAAALALVALACGVAPAQKPAECTAYLDCYAKTGGTGEPTPPFGDTENCWSGTQASSAACKASCTARLDAVKAAYPDSGCP